mmetsp:Transcript_101527/g.171891  ORF Transcript_101527/g.171891 Transcript_101527/m.171891 type:complete len:186 (-) Transcript_101527:522-1079(-)
MLDLLEDKSFFSEGEDVYVDVTALISSCKSAQRDEYRKSNLAAEEDIEKLLELHNVRVREMLRHGMDVFGALLPTATVEQLVSMDVELLDDPQSPSVRSRPFPANADDRKEIMRQICECISSDLAEEYTKTDYTKHCSPCVVVENSGGSARRLVVHYGKLNKLTKRHWETLPSLKRALVRASAYR